MQFHENVPVLFPYLRFECFYACHSGSAVLVVKRRLAEAGQLHQPPLTLLTDGRRAHSEPSGAHTVKVFGQGAKSSTEGL